MTDFLFNLVRVVFRDIQKIERYVRMCISIPQKTCNETKRLKISEEVDKYFPGFIAFIDCTEQ